MTSADLEIRLLEILRTHWRIRAGLALMRGSPPFATGNRMITYTGISGYGVTAGIMNSETVRQALEAVARYEKDRLPSDVFLLIIAAFESFLSDRLQAAGGIGKGTLGNLMSAAESHFALSGAEKILAAEVLHRRNCWIHLHGKADAKYAAAVTAAIHHSSGSLTAVGIGAPIIPNEHYLAYCVDVLVRYGRLIP